MSLLLWFLSFLLSFAIAIVCALLLSFCYAKHCLLRYIFPLQNTTKYFRQNTAVFEVVWVAFSYLTTSRIGYLWLRLFWFSYFYGFTLYILNYVICIHKACAFFYFCLRAFMFKCICTLLLILMRSNYNVYGNSNPEMSSIMLVCTKCRAETFSCLSVTLVKNVKFFKKKLFTKYKKIKL